MPCRAPSLLKTSGTPENQAVKMLWCSFTPQIAGTADRQKSNGRPPWWPHSAEACSHSYGVHAAEPMGTPPILSCTRHNVEALASLDNIYRLQYYTIHYG